MPACRLLLLLVVVALSASCARALRLKGSVDSRLSSAEDVFIGSFKFQKDGGSVAIRCPPPPHVHLTHISNPKPRFICSGMSRTEGQRVLFFDETVANWAIILETYNTMSCLELQKANPPRTSPALLLRSVLACLFVSPFAS